MSVIAHGKNTEIPAAASQAGRGPIASVALMIFGALRTAIVGTAHFVILVAEAFAEARIQRANIEIELYRDRFKHSSKSDDDLPVIR